MNRTLYTLIFTLALPFILLRLLWRGRKATAYRQRIGERLALGLPEVPPGGIWVHAVSVGESIAAARLALRVVRERRTPTHDQDRHPPCAPRRDLPAASRSQSQASVDARRFPHSVQPSRRRAALQQALRPA